MPTIVAVQPAPNFLAIFPQKVNGWKCVMKPQAYDAKTIFDYMNGAAEIYLTYSFRRLYTALYKRGEVQIAVEVYDMGTPAEAFGIFSNELEGDVVPIGQGGRYNFGILRCWKHRYFVRIAGTEDSKAVRKFATQMAKLLVSKIPKEGGLPAMVLQLNKSKLKVCNARYFHRDYNLNNIYYVSTENVLMLGNETNAVLADVKLPGKLMKVLVVHYPKKATRNAALKRFCERILTEKAQRYPNGASIEETRKGEFTGIRALDTKLKQ
ncbi:MAG TPA: hypothetical protein EYP90_06755, partial [Chromatiaceae bacterium]|nr:hypothetical protein [Chromatiaceae bacterium]